ncbi:PTS system oligo-beta-mannoside-specific EIIB component [Weizmannia acidilactici]|jgi:PTS system cellobiose-specific IIB component|uniref:PTS system oligo-beta-mannoside-specific EIIB component n=1 Tax=Weizmannia acidilactici TaxID=2607726 RepID=A0A5J4JGL5_9BACI|nr:MULTISPECIES: PTS sugar transporter subunit IIB [Heyndrickxia]MEC2222608.1 PTS sugar transporter subunit IIB [Weizmannia sp. CD-2023]MED4405890.1 PTS sugar transporter subunit IIB [Heyndrickxia coagulans]GER67401.1 PTS system oligo-beta-mannoside-specific EIIB component [Weizmannia acidilactici]GER70499.1 PTS system oligo-beta-mannoside-specific EIIB component [Weizmannia acidilactici]GER72599.1 PTS system oligo-beta-mannoside-specific EIIB component [Weizmannia acidilactici]
MKKILLACSSGMSTSLLVSKMRQYAESIGDEAEIWAVGQDQAQDEMANADVLLIGPQMRFMKKKLEKYAEEAGIPIDVIDPVAYGRVDGEAVYKKALELIGK